MTTEEKILLIRYISEMASDGDNKMQLLALVQIERLVHWKPQDEVTPELVGSLNHIRSKYKLEAYRNEKN